MLNHPGDLVQELDSLSTDEECEEFCRYAAVKFRCEPRSAMTIPRLGIRNCYGFVLKALRQLVWPQEVRLNSSRRISRDGMSGSQLSSLESDVWKRFMTVFRVGNSFAIVRPPGHHAFGRVPQGYCVYNNVAIAAKYATDRLGLKRVRISQTLQH